MFEMASEWVTPASPPHYSTEVDLFVKSLLEDSCYDKNVYMSVFEEDITSLLGTSLGEPGISGDAMNSEIEQLEEIIAPPTSTGTPSISSLEKGECDAVVQAQQKAKAERKKKFAERKQGREALLMKTIVKKEGRENDVSYRRRLVCNRDSAAARRKADSAMHNELCNALQNVEAEIAKLEYFKYMCAHLTSSAIELPVVNNEADQAASVPAA